MDLIATIMNNKKLLLAVLVSTCGFSAVSQAATYEPTPPPEAPVPVVGDVSSAFVEWSGIAKVIPGDNIIITGARSSAVKDGILIVKGDGTFTTKTPIDLESRLYWDKDLSGTKTAGDLFATEWTIDADGITASWGANSVAGMNIKMKDLETDTDITTDAGVNATTVRLSVQSDSAVVSEEPLNLLEPLVVNANVLATVV